MKQILSAVLTALLLIFSSVPAWAAEPAETKPAATPPAASSEKAVKPLKKAVKPLEKTAKPLEKEATPPVDESWMLQLVNRENPIAEAFVPVYEAIQNNFVMDERVAPIVREMIADARKVGVELVVNSAYRPYSSQQRIYNAKIQEYLSWGYSAENAKIMTELYVAVPGYSEHQLGLAADIVAVDYQVLNGGYAATATAQWLALNAPSYGFILRYPQDKTAITHTAFEPWHFRYVGKTAAKEITEQGVCLEEYLEKLENVANSAQILKK